MGAGSSAGVALGAASRIGSSNYHSGAGITKLAELYADTSIENGIVFARPITGSDSIQRWGVTAGDFKTLRQDEYVCPEGHDVSLGVIVKTISARGMHGAGFTGQLLMSEIWEYISKHHSDMEILGFYDASKKPLQYNYVTDTKVPLGAVWLRLSKQWTGFDFKYQASDDSIHFTDQGRKKSVSLDDIAKIVTSGYGEYDFYGFVGDNAVADRERLDAIRNGSAGPITSVTQKGENCKFTCPWKEEHEVAMTAANAHFLNLHLQNHPEFTGEGDVTWNTSDLLHLEDKHGDNASYILHTYAIALVPSLQLFLSITGASWRHKTTDRWDKKRKLSGPKDLLQELELFCNQNDFYSDSTFTIEGLKSYSSKSFELHTVDSLGGFDAEHVTANPWALKHQHFGWQYLLNKMTPSSIDKMLAENTQYTTTDLQEVFCDEYVSAFPQGTFIAAVSGFRNSLGSYDIVFALKTGDFSAVHYYFNRRWTRYEFEEVTPPTNVSEWAKAAREHSFYVQKTIVGDGWDKSMRTSDFNFLRTEEGCTELYIRQVFDLIAFNANNLIVPFVPVDDGLDEESRFRVENQLRETDAEQASTEAAPIQAQETIKAMRHIKPKLPKPSIPKVTAWF